MVDGIDIMFIVIITIIIWFVVKSSLSSLSKVRIIIIVIIVIIIIIIWFVVKSSCSSLLLSVLSYGSLSKVGHVDAGSGLRCLRPLVVLVAIIVTVVTIVIIVIVVVIVIDK